MRKLGADLSLKEFQACVEEALKLYWLGDWAKFICTQSGREIFVVLGEATFTISLRRDR